MKKPEQHQDVQWLGQHISYFRHGLQQIAITRPQAELELPEVAAYAAQADPDFRVLHLGDSAMATIFGRSAESTANRRRRAYLARHDLAYGIMDFIVRAGEATRAPIAELCIDKSYGHQPNEDGYLYRPAADPALFDRTFREAGYLPSVTDAIIATSAVRLPLDQSASHPV